MTENHRLPSEELAAFVVGYPYGPIPEETLRENFGELVEPESGRESVRRIIGRVEYLGEDGLLKPPFGMLSPATNVAG